MTRCWVSLLVAAGTVGVTFGPAWAVDVTLNVTPAAGRVGSPVTLSEARRVDQGPIPRPDDIA
jgi:hypothetical protein